MPANKEFEQGVLPQMLEDIGFEKVKVEDLSHNIEPMLCLFFTLPTFHFYLFGFLALKSGLSILFQVWKPIGGGNFRGILL